MRAIFSHRRSILPFRLSALLQVTLLAGCLNASPPAPPRPPVDSAPAADAHQLAIVDSEASLGDYRAQLARAYGVDALEPASVGYYLDVQYASLQPLAQSTLEIERREDHIHLVMPGAGAFGSDSFALAPPAQRTLDQLAEQLLEYHQTLVAIEGHSDNQGDSGYNLALSRHRAIAVGNYLAARGIPPSRIAVRGFGAARPRADNASDHGRAANRRIELALWPLVSSATVPAG